MGPWPIVSSDRLQKPRIEAMVYKAVVYPLHHSGSL